MISGGQTVFRKSFPLSSRALGDQPGGKSHGEHGWQAGGYMNSLFFFTGGEKAQLTKDKK